jgi:hypothetical protein
MTEQDIQWLICGGQHTFQSVHIRMWMPAYTVTPYGAYPGPITRIDTLPHCIKCGVTSEV